MGGLVNYATKVTLGGAEYAAREMTHGQFTAINQWLRGAVPSPIAVVKPELEGLSEAERLAVLVRAYESMEGGRWPVEWGSNLARLLVISRPDGRAAFVAALLSEDYPNLTRAQTDAIARSATKLEILNAIALAEGIDAMAEVEAMVDPKAPGDRSTSPKPSDDLPSESPGTTDSPPTRSTG